MTFRYYLLLIFASETVVSCAPRVDKTQFERVSPPPQINAIVGCDLLKLNFNKSEPDFRSHEQSLHLERHLQRVVRKNCDGSVRSDKIESVKPATGTLTLPSQSRKPFKGVFVFNETSCDHFSIQMPTPLLPLFHPITGDGRNQIKLHADMSDAAFTFKFNPGRNRVLVKFYHDCNPPALPGNEHGSFGERTCQESKDSSVEEYIVQIDSEEKTLEGFKVIEPVTSECQQPERSK